MNAADDDAALFLRRASFRAVLAWLLVGAALPARPAFAGPPYLTDDPEPVPTGHWEFYAASQWTVGRDASSGTSPHVEVNYGPLPGVQLHAIVPAVVAVRSGAPTSYGLGDLELGAKLRLVKESARCPEIGIFPLIMPPTGSKRRGLGSGSFEAFLPVWLQKDFGRWTTSGGAGIDLAPEGNSTSFGWLLQRSLSHGLTPGAEAFVTVPAAGGATETQLNAGLVVDFGAEHHLLMSAGPSFGTDDRWQAYLAYLRTI